MFRRFRITRRYMSVTTLSMAETLQDIPGLHRDAPGRLKDTPDIFSDLVDTHRWGLRTIIVLADVSLSTREFYDNIGGVCWELVTTGSQWL